MAFSKNAEYLLKKRYCRRGESINSLFEIIAGVISNGDFNFGIQLEEAMTEGYFLPASPIFATSAASIAI